MVPPVEDIAGGILSKCVRLKVLAHLKCFEQADSIACPASNIMLGDLGRKRFIDR